MFHLQVVVLMLAMAEPTASAVFCNRMLSMVNSEDVNAIIQAQRHMWVSLRYMCYFCNFTTPSLISFSCDSKSNHTRLAFCSLASLNITVLTLYHFLNNTRLDRFEKTNEMLINFNGLSNVRLQQMNEHFLLHTRTLVEMKKDLDSIFRRIR